MRQWLRWNLCAVMMTLWLISPPWNYVETSIFGTAPTRQFSPSFDAPTQLFAGDKIFYVFFDSDLVQVERAHTLSTDTPDPSQVFSCSRNDFHFWFPNPGSREVRKKQTFTHAQNTVCWTLATAHEKVYKKNLLVIASSSSPLGYFLWKEKWEFIQWPDHFASYRYVRIFSVLFTRLSIRYELFNSLQNVICHLAIPNLLRWRTICRPFLLLQNSNYDHCDNLFIARKTKTEDALLFGNQRRSLWHYGKEIRLEFS